IPMKPARFASARCALWQWAVWGVWGFSLCATVKGQEAVVSPGEGTSIRYSITLVGTRAILLDQASGRTWMLTESSAANEPPVWTPLLQVEGAPVEHSLSTSPDSNEDQLNALKSQLHLAQKRYPPEHPKVLELQKR